MISESGISKLPAEVLSVIFTQCMNCPAFLPYSLTKTPAQIVISHVCLSWRYVALGARNLWANVCIRYPFKKRQVYSAWLARAGQHPIFLVLNFYNSVNSDRSPISTTFWRFVRHLSIRHLRVPMCAEDFCDLWATGQDALPYLERLDIDLNLLDTSVFSFNIPAAVIGKIHSATFALSGYYYYEQEEWLTRQLALPWAQLRDFKINVWMLLSWYITVLQQMPLLEQCFLKVSVDKAAENMGHVTLSHLQSLTLGFIRPEGHVDAVIRHFTCPNLMLLDIQGTSYCSLVTWDLIRKQYNLHRLQDLSITLSESFVKNFILSSVIFRDAPMLRNLSVGDIAIMDEETCAGMAIGAFGRLLRSLEVSCKQSDVGVILGMVKDRQLAVEERLRPGCSWQEEMASLKQLTLNCFSGTDRLDSSSEGPPGVIELERLGITVTVYNSSYDRSLMIVRSTLPYKLF